MLRLRHRHLLSGQVRGGAWGGGAGEVPTTPPFLLVSLSPSLILTSVSMYFRSLSICLLYLSSIYPCLLSFHYCMRFCLLPSVFSSYYPSFLFIVIFFYLSLSIIFPLSQSTFPLSFHHIQPTVSRTSIYAFSPSLTFLCFPVSLFNLFFPFPIPPFAIFTFIPFLLHFFPVPVPHRLKLVHPFLLFYFRPGYALSVVSCFFHTFNSLLS